jgi:hypothetical protein
MPLSLILKKGKFTISTDMPVLTEDIVLMIFSKEPVLTLTISLVVEAADLIQFLNPSLEEEEVLVDNNKEDLIYFMKLQFL